MITKSFCHQKVKFQVLSSIKIKIIILILSLFLFNKTFQLTYTFFKKFLKSYFYSYRDIRKLFHSV